MNWSTFFEMGGYAPYIWSAYGIAAAVLVFNAIQPLRYRRALLKRLRSYYRLRNENK